MADIKALHVELTKFYLDKEPGAQLNGPVDAWHTLELSGVFVPGRGGLRFLLDFARSDECGNLINSDELLVRVVKQMETAIEEISAVLDIARKYLPADAGEAAEESEYMYDAKGEKVCVPNSGDGDDPFRRNLMRKFTRQE